MARPQPGGDRPGGDRRGGDRAGGAADEPRRRFLDAVKLGGSILVAVLLAGAILAILWFSGTGGTR